MMQDVDARNDLSPEGNPAGGYAYAKGISIRWQDGALGRGEERREPNGAFVETVIAIAKRRLEFYQASKFLCYENEVAIEMLEKALQILNRRTEAREARQVEGTHAI